MKHRQTLIYVDISVNEPRLFLVELKPIYAYADMHTSSESQINMLLTSCLGKF